MRVAVVTGGRDAHGLGLEQAELCLLRALAHEGHRRVRVVGGRSARAYARRLRTERLAARWVPSRPGWRNVLAWTGVDLVHLAGLSVAPPARTPFVATVWDLAALHFSDEGELPPWTPDLVRSARMVLTHSEFVAAEVCSLLGVDRARIRVVSSGPARDLSSVAPLSPAELTELGIEAPFVVRTGGYTTRKHVDLLLAAWPQVRRRHPRVSLVLAGPVQAARAPLLSAAPSLDGVRVLDFLPGDVVGRLVRSAAVAVSPSRYEGFGLPPLEAMTGRTPVVALRTPFAEEVCADAALLVEDDPEALAEAVHRVLVDDDLASQLRSRGVSRATQFTWASTARACDEAYRSAVAAET